MKQSINSVMGFGKLYKTAAEVSALMGIRYYEAIAEIDSIKERLSVIVVGGEYAYAMKARLIR